jgi:hypothetical protein
MRYCWKHFVLNTICVMPSHTQSKYLEFIGKLSKASPPGNLASRHALATNFLDESIVRRDMTIEGIQSWASFALLAENVAPDPPWQHAAELMAHEGPRWHCKDVVELFESTLLGLRDKQEDHAKGAYVKSSVETKGACCSHGAEHAWESDGQHRGPEKASGHSPRHTDLYQND